MKKLLVDLDGTLTDPQVGIARCIRHALSLLGLPCPDNLDFCIGPPLAESLNALGVEHGLLPRALSLYRERFAATGIYENAVYPDIPAMLDELRKNGFDLFVATSKPSLHGRL